jgi:hypothetical protein
MKALLILLSFIFLFFTIDVRAQLRPVEKQGIADRSAFINEGFENGKKGWDLSNATFGFDNNDLTNRTAAINVTAQIVSLKQESTAMADFEGSQGIAYCKVLSSVKGLNIRVLANGVQDSNLTLPIQASGTWRIIEIPFIVDGTSNGIEIYSDSNIIVNFQVDDCYIALAPAGYVKEIATANTDWEYFGPIKIEATTTNPIKASNLEVDQVLGKRNQNLLQLKYIYRTNGTATGASAGSGDYLFSLPNNLEFDSDKVDFFTGSIGSTTPNDLDWRLYGKVNGTIDGVDHFVEGGIVPYDATRFRIKYRGSSNAHRFIRNNAAETTRVNTGYTVEFAVPIKGWRNSIDTVVTQRTELGIDDVNEFKAFVLADGTVTESKYDWIDGNCTNVASPVCTFNSGVFSETPFCTFATSNGGTAGVISNTGSAQTSDILTSSVTIRTTDAGDASLVARPGVLTCSRTGGDYKTTKTIVGNFANINDSETCEVFAANNSGGSVTANTTDINFTEESDTCNLWDGTEYVSDKDVTLSITGQVASVSAPPSWNIILYRDGVADIKLGFCQADVFCDISKIVKTTAGEVLSIRSSDSFTLNQTPFSHTLQIKELPSLSAVVKNLATNLKGIDQFTTIEKIIGVYDSNPLYRFCFNTPLSNGEVIVTSVDRLVRCYGEIDFGSQQLLYPFNNGTDVQSCRVNSSGDLVNVSNGTRTVHGCVEYTR